MGGQPYVLLFLVEQAESSPYENGRLRDLNRVLAKIWNGHCGKQVREPTKLKNILKHKSGLRGSASMSALLNIRSVKEMPQIPKISPTIAIFQGD